MSAAPDDTFLRLVAPHRDAVRLHCYRMLGSSHDGDDVLQETMVRAWRARDSLANAEAVRPWLYRIATNACLDELKDRKGRPMPVDVAEPVADFTASPAPASPEATWLEPVPDAWIAGVGRDPGAAYDVKESVALAFVAALQCLSVRQRAVLLLRDVLGMPAEEAATALEMTVPAANSALHRAREALREHVGLGAGADVVDLTSEVNEDLLRRYLRAWETLDHDGLVALLHDEITASMPPSPTWLRGAATVAAFLKARPFVILRDRKRALFPAPANGQPAIAFYVDGELHALQILRFKEGRVIELHHFCDRDSFAAFGLARTLTGASGAMPG
ncbi:MAG TPA: RNA polymerase subunit sigma-70 [Polyangiaceae bacterium]|jgi:RNA polymerase sigma-70 factor (ECF subfamily)|nr:RNA polymerase subunit sigma-70 [Polyangiaceae bacterium]